MKKLVKRITATIFTVILVVSSIGNHTIKAYAAEESLVGEMEAMAVAQAQAEAEAAAQAQAQAEAEAAAAAAAQAEAEAAAAAQAQAEAEAAAAAQAQAEAEAAAAAAAAQAQAEADAAAAAAAAQAEAAAAAAAAQAQADADAAAAQAQAEADAAAAAAQAQAEADAKAEADKKAAESATAAAQTASDTNVSESDKITTEEVNENKAPQDTADKGASTEEKKEDEKPAEKKEETEEKKEDDADKKDADEEKEKEKDKDKDKEEEEDKEKEEEKEDEEEEEEEEKEDEVTEKEYTVTIFYEASEGGKVSVEKETLTWKETTTVDKDGKETVEKEPATITAKGATATADKDFEFAGWTLNGETVSEEETFVPQVPEEDITYKAQFLDKEEEYPAQSWTGETADVRVSASVGEGVFPEDTEMKVAAVSKQAVMDASQELTDENTEVVDAVGVDITFYNKDGEEIQPKGAVNVSLSAKRTLEGENQYAVTVDDGGNASVVADANANGANIVTDHFTVYGIYTTEYTEEQGVEQFVRYTYRFFMSEKDTEPFYTQILKQVSEKEKEEGATDESLVTPALPAGDGKTECEGWYARDAEGELTIRIESGLTVPGEDEAGEDKVFDVYPKYNTRFEVIYYADEEKSAVLDTVTVSGEKHMVDKELTPKDGEKEEFVGWKKYGNASDTVVESVNKDDADEEGRVHLVPMWDTYHTLYFDGNGADPESYKATVRVKDGEPAGEIQDPAREGYGFDGWYENYEDATDPDFEGDPFDFENTRITKSMTFYANWEAEMRTFTVEVREENANDNGYTTVLVAEMETVKKGEGADASYTNIPIDKIIATYCNAKTGFHLNGTGAYDTPGNQRFQKTGEDAAFKDDRAAIEVLQGGSVVASYDGDGRLIDGDPSDIDWSENGGKVEVYVNYSRDQYKLFFRFSEDISADNKGVVHIPGNETPKGNPINGSWNLDGDKVIGGKSLKEVAPEVGGQPLLDLQKESIFFIKYGESLYECVYLKSPKIRAFMDQGDPWYFLTDYYRDITGQAVFDKTNPMNVFKPMTGAEDGQGLVCLILYKPDWATFPITRIFHGNDGSTWEYTLKPEYYKDHNHTFTKGSVYQAGYHEGDGEFQGYIIERVEGGNLKKGTWDSYEQCTFTFKETEDPKVRQALEIYYYPTTYTITFDLNGVTVDGITGTSFNGTVKGEKEIYKDTDISDVYHGFESGVTRGTKDGKTYVFKGWYTYPTCPAGTEAVFSGKTMPPYNLTYYAKWEPANLDVTFHPENGEASFTKQVAPNGKVAFEGAPKGSAEGKTFKYWAVKDANDKPVKFDFATSITEHKDLYAVWEDPELPYRVQYVTDTKKGTLPAGLDESDFDPASYKEDAQAAVFGKAVPKEGFVFVGWRIGDTEIVLDGKDGKKGFTVSDYADDDHVTTLVAQYAEVSEETTTVTYHANYPPNGGKDDAATEKTVDEALVSKDAADKKKIAVNGSVLIDENGETCAFIPNGPFRFVCWTNKEGPSLFTQRGDREIFYKGDLAGAQAKGNNLFALWEVVQEEVEYTVTKVWDDANDKDRMRPATVTIEVYNGDTLLQTLALDGDGNTWTNAFSVPKYDEGGNEIVYSFSVKETTVPEGYTAETDGLTVTNSHTPKEEPKDEEEEKRVGGTTEETTEETTTVAEQETATTTVAEQATTTTEPQATADPIQILLNFLFADPTTTTTAPVTLADIPAQDPEDLPAPEDTIPANLPDANAPGVLGMARRTSTLDTMMGAQVRNYDNPEVLGSRRGKTGEQSDATRMMTIMGAGIILAALAKDKRRREKEE